MAARIEVGINENIHLRSAVLDDKDNLILTFKNDEVELSGFEALQSEEIVEGNGGKIELRIFPPTPPKVENKTLEKQQELAVADVTRMRAILEHIMKGYMTKDEANLAKVMYLNTGIDKDNFAQKILDKEVLLAIFRNAARAFLERMRPYLGNPELKFRLKLVRQSKEKHFATLPGRYLDDQPFWESMDVAKEASKVKFSDYEIKEGLNDGTPAARDKAADKPSESTPTTLTAENVFGA